MEQGANAVAGIDVWEHACDPKHRSRRGDWRSNSGNKEALAIGARAFSRCLMGDSVGSHGKVGLGTANPYVRHARLVQCAANLFRAECK